MIIGICGKSGCGKSTLAHRLVELFDKEAIQIDVDKIWHNLLTTNIVKEELVYHFGNVIVSDNIIDRKKLGKIVFNSKEAMDKLNEIAWKYIQVEIDKTIKENSEKIIILDWHLLPLSKYYEMCDFKILLDVPYETRMARAMARDNISEEKFKLREDASIDYNPQDFDLVVFDNNKDTVKRLVMSL